MDTILLPVMSPADAKQGAARAIARHRASPVRVLLLNVQRPLPRHVARYFAAADVRAYLHDAGMHVLAPVIAALDAAGVPHEDHVQVGHPAAAIVEFARTHGCGDVVLDEPAHGFASLLGAGSVRSQVRHLMQGSAA